MCYITAHRYSVFDVCYATLGYHVLCRYTKHADLFEPELLGEPNKEVLCLTVGQDVKKGCSCCLIVVFMMRRL